MATEHLRHTIVVDSPMPVVDEQYDKQKMWWTFTFRNAGCEVDVIVDRCSSDIGGIKEGCKLRKGT